MYVKLKLNESDGDDVAIDASGYTGKFHRAIDNKNWPHFSIE